MKIQFRFLLVAYLFLGFFGTHPFFPQVNGQLIGPDDWALRTSGISNKDEELLKFLQKRSICFDDLKNLDKLVGQLGSDSFQVREEASAKLEMLDVVAASGFTESHTRWRPGSSDPGQKAGGTNRIIETS